MNLAKKNGCFSMQDCFDGIISLAFTELTEEDTIYYNDEPSEGKKFIEKYKKIHKTFEESTIYQLCCDISNSIENNDYNHLKHCIQQYKESNEVDKFMNNILNKIDEKVKKRNPKDSVTTEVNDNED